MNYSFFDYQHKKVNKCELKQDLNYLKLAKFVKTDDND